MIYWAILASTLGGLSLGFTLGGHLRELRLKGS